MNALHIIDNLVVDSIEVEDLNSYTPPNGVLIAGDGRAGIGWKYINGSFFYPYPSNSDQNIARKLAYQLRSDPVFFMYQRGEKTQQEWLDQVQEIKSSIPYYYDEDGNPLYDNDGNLLP